jgi:tripartite-type tricarboxylate transporter receptor subunit TctC
VERSFHWMSAVAIAAVLASPVAAAADAYPAKPVRLAVGFAAGGPTDILARAMAQSLSDSLKQSFIVENRPGAGGNVATEAVVKAAPDGYTLLVIATSNAINTTLYPSLPFNFMRDITPVAGLARISYVMAAHPSVPAANVAELVSYAKANPGKLSFGSGGTGTSNHLSGELFKVMTGIDMLHVPYKGNAAAYADLITGRIQLLFADRASALPHLKSGAVRALAVTSEKRSEAMPNVQAVAESVPGYEASAWYGFGAPRGTPAEAIAMLNKAINTALGDPKLRARFADFDAAPIVMTPAAFGAFMASEAERWGRAVKASGAKPE